MQICRIFIFFAFIFNTVQVLAYNLKGVAKRIDTKELVYIEEHTIERDALGFSKKITTKYLKPDGKIIGQIVSDFSKNKLVPETVFEDYRFNKIESLNLVDGEAIFKLTVNGKVEKSTKHKFNDKMVAAQGFDNFIKLRFDDLMKAEVPLEFGALSEMKFFSFKGYKKQSASANNHQFGITLANPLLRVFLSELIVTYDAKTKQLLTYQGLSNILDEKQQTQKVFIEYELNKM